MEEIKDNQGNGGNKKPLIYYYLVCLIVLMLLNALVTPMLTNRQIIDVSYNDFLSMIDSGRVREVAYDDSDGAYMFVAEDDSGREGVYRTGVWPGDGERLLSQLRENPEVKFLATIPVQENPLLTFLVSWIFPILLFFIIGNLLSRSMMKRLGASGGLGNALQFGKSGAKVYVPDEHTGVTFNDVAGQDEAKESLKEVVSFLHDPGKYSEIGAKLPKGVLLVGPPGTGKTLLAKAVAGEAEVPFFSISGSEFVEMFVGMGAAKVRDLFKQANEKAPCIVFIDEIDAIGKKRDASGFSGNDEREQTLNQLLAEMDGFDAKKGVVLLAATNRPESLDPALLRPGRFDRRVPVELPDLAGRVAIFKVHAAGVKTEEGIDWNALGRATAGASGAEIANMVNEAALRAVRMHREKVNQEDLEVSIETVVAGAERKSAVVSEKDKRLVSYHEVGHALVAALESGTAPVTKITIVPHTGGALGYTMQVESEEKLLMSKSEILSQIETLTGGRAAEELVYGRDNMTTGASNDIEKATKLARMMITRYGMSDEFGMVALETESNRYLGGDASLQCSEKTAGEIDALVFKTVQNAHDRAYSILEENREKLEKIASYLYEKETITGDEFMRILNEGK